MLLLVAALLAIAAAFDAVGIEFASVAVMALAMGAENAVFERNGEVSIGVTYMTGTLVKLGQRITAALLGGDRWAWEWYLFLWLGLVAGAMSGAVVYSRIGLAGLWAAAAAAALLAVLVRQFASHASSGDATGQRLSILAGRGRRDR